MYLGNKKEKRKPKRSKIKLQLKTTQRRHSFLMNRITQDMKYRQSLMNYAKNYGVSRASRKYNRCRSYIYFGLNRYDGSLLSLQEKSRRPHGHASQHRQEKIKHIQDMRQRNPNLGLIKLWCRLRQRGYRVAAV